MSELLRLLVMSANRQLSRRLAYELARPPLSKLVEVRNEAKVVLERFERGYSSPELHGQAVEVSIDLASTLYEVEKL